MKTATSHLLPGRRARIAAASVLVHLLLIVAIVHRSRVWVAPVRLPGTVRGTRMVLTYLPGPAPSASSVSARVKPLPRLVPPRPAMRPALTIAQTAPVASPSLQASQQTPGSGVDALGEGDISIALMQFFPDPNPDLTRLPHGSRGDVVLEAIIDANGRIAQLTVKQGVGYGVDQSVIATVEQWTFHPAMRDGKPIPSRQELHFHYERG